MRNIITSSVAVGCTTCDEEPQARALAAKLQLKFNNHADILLLVSQDTLSLKVKSFVPVSADFSIAKWQKRRDAGSNQGLIQACKPKLGMRIIDATAGWGRDAAILSCFGAQVLLLERNPIMGELLANALFRRDPRAQKHLSLTLLICDALEYLTTLAADNYPDLIYLDPMHPQRQKSALVKKDLQILQQLISINNDATKLLQLALTKTRHSVVIKWARYADALLKPSRTIFTKTLRFDIYYV